MPLRHLPRRQRPTPTPASDEELDALLDAETLPSLPADAKLTTTESGLQYYDYIVGTGDVPSSTIANVVVDYAGFLESGARFDSGREVSFALNRLIQGFTEGVSTMKEGGQRRIVIPPDLGYGANGNSNAGIGGDDTIVFIVKLISTE